MGYCLATDIGVSGDRHKNGFTKKLNAGKTQAEYKNTAPSGFCRKGLCTENQSYATAFR